MPLPNAPACERNREPILDVLRDYFADRRQVLEIGSGTGQHAVLFCRRAAAAELAVLATAARLPARGIGLRLDQAGAAPTRRHRWRWT